MILHKLTGFFIFVFLASSGAGFDVIYPGEEDVLNPSSG